VNSFLNFAEDNLYCVCTYDEGKTWVL